MKVLIFIAIVVMVPGCSKSEPRDPRFQKLIDEHNGQTSWFECKGGFLEEHHIWDTPSQHAVSLVKNDAGVPTRCNVEDVTIRVKETVATGGLSGSVN